ncbi:hypothetical protein EMIT0215P_50082 [Pseudomonas serboccidentalis]
MNSTCDSECFLSFAVIAPCRITGNMHTIVVPKPKRHFGMFDLKIEWFAECTKLESAHHFEPIRSLF